MRKARFKEQWDGPGFLLAAEPLINHSGKNGVNPVNPLIFDQPDQHR